MSSNKPGRVDYHSDTDLCLACSSSLPPRTKSKEAAGEIYITRCCSRPICPACISRNPRLARYNPCLHCLGGVSAVSSSSRVALAQSKPSSELASGVTNVDGAVRDEDVFVLGDEDEQEAEEATLALDGATSTPPPAYQSHTSLSSQSDHGADTDVGVGDPHEALPSSDNDNTEATDSSPSFHPHRYYIKPNDTLIGIALKYKLDGHVLCRMNNLPPSTLRTTPHLLYTRTYLTLPAVSKFYEGTTDQDHERDERRARERAEKRLQAITKEADWRVAKAYVAVAALPDHNRDHSDTLKTKEGQSSERKSIIQEGTSSTSLEAQAVDRYLDDAEWEERERREGRGVFVPRFPLAGEAGQAQKDEKESRSWWASWKR